jgi:hypothetical protein
MAGGQSIRCHVVSSNDRSRRWTDAGRSGFSGRVRIDSVPEALPCGFRSNVSDARPVAAPNGGTCLGSSRSLVSGGSSYVPWGVRTAVRTSLPTVRTMATSASEIV